MPPNYQRKRQAQPRLQAIDDPDSGLPKLTVKQEAFMLGLLDGKSAREAYRAAFDCSTMGEGSIGVEASRLARSPKIALSLRLHQRIGACQAGVTKERHLAELARGREIAYELGQASAGIQAEHYRGRVAGLYNDKLALTIGPSDEALLAQLGALLGDEAAKAIGRELSGEGPEILALPGPLESDLP